MVRHVVFIVWAVPSDRQTVGTARLPIPRLQRRQQRNPTALILLFHGDAKGGGGGVRGEGWEEG